MNWKELKEFCNSLSEEQLAKKVVVWREDYAISRLTPSCLEEDMYIHVDGSDEGCYPLSDATEPFEELKKVYDKGDPILFEEF